MPKVPDDVDLDALRAEQERLASRVRHQDDLPDEVDLVAGFDAAYGDETVHGALALVSRPDLETVTTVTAAAPLELPYIPGLLAYRELPALEAVWQAAQKQALVPDLLLVDGGGLIHPRRFGSASHAGVVLELPTVGITKSLLLGTIDVDLEAYGDTAPVRDGEELLGYAYRSSRRAQNPIYVSPGHRVGPETALDLVQTCSTGERKLPEPVHRAHVAAGQARDGGEM